MHALVDGLVGQGFGEVALAEILPTATELERLWAHRGGTVGQWERARVPRALRQHVVALEKLISELCSLTELLADPDEQC
ncbi:hypothetical protein [Streptomyces sp. YGL11-2]|uniref:hypothetical protein n=1 Tax=Streptomyces sp. YGL11-2 TaxID=3414028 RepID=UPI003CF73C93